jgi:hypothetical protein
MPGQFEGILDKLQTKLGKQTIKRASTINRPRPKLNVIQIKAINDFVKRNPRADGGSVNGSEQAAFRAKVEELMDDGYDFGEAVREAMRQGYDKGGRVPFQSGGYSYKNFPETYEFGERARSRGKYGFFEKFGVNITGKESPEELTYLKDLLEEFQKEIPNLSPRDRGGVYLAGKRSSLKTIARDYADFGKENIDAVAKEMGIDYASSHREQRKAIKKYLAQRKSASSADDARLLFDKQDEIKKTYDTLVENYRKKNGRFPGQSDKVKLNQEAINRIAGRERSDIARKLKNFKNEEVVLIKENGRIKDVVFKDPKKQAEFIADLEYRFSFPESGKEASSYAKKAGVMDQEAFRKKYFKKYSKSTVNDITGAVSKTEGFKKPTVKEFIYEQIDGALPLGELSTDAAKRKAAKKLGLRHYINNENQLIEFAAPTKAKRLSIDEKLDPFGIKRKIGETKRFTNVDTSHSIKQGLLNPDKPGIQLKAETLETLYPVRSDLNKGQIGRFENSVLNIAENELRDVAKQRNSLIDNAGKVIKGKENELARLNAKGTKIARNFSQADEMFGAVYRGAPGKASGPTNVKGVLNFEVFTPNADGTISKKLVGGNRAKSFAGVTDNPIAKTALAELDTPVKRAAALQLVEDAGTLKNAVSRLKGSQLGSVCRVLSKLAEGGRVGFASGGTMANCLRAIDNNPTAAVRAIASIGKSSGKLRSVVNIAKGVLKTTGYGLLAEAAFAAPFAIADLRAGESGKRILGNATLGLVGDTVTDEQKEFMGEKGYRAFELQKANEAYNALGLASEESFSPDDDMLISERITQADNTLNKKLEPYIMEDGTFNETQFNQDYGIAQAGLKNIEDVKKMRRDKIQEGIRNRVDPYANDFMAAKGGLATLPRKVDKPTNYGIVGTKVYNN